MGSKGSVVYEIGSHPDLDAEGEAAEDASIAGSSVVDEDGSGEAKNWTMYT